MRARILAAAKTLARRLLSLDARPRGVVLTADPRRAGRPGVHYVPPEVRGVPRVGVVADDAAPWDDNPPDDCEAPESHPECPCVRPEEAPSPRPTFADGQRWRSGMGNYTTGRGVMPGTIEVFDECGMVSDVFQNGAEAPRGWYLIEEAPAKPSRVLPGQVWRCVGVDGELSVEARYDIPTGAPGSAAIELRTETDARVHSNEHSMLGLKVWSFVRGPR